MIKTKLISIPPDPTGENRDAVAGRIYLLTEMPASQAEIWAFRMLNLLAASGLTIPDEMLNAGLAGLAVTFSGGDVSKMFANFSGLAIPEFVSLMNEMFQCVQIQYGHAGAPPLYRRIVEEDIEEVSTRLKLRGELFKMHMGFLKGARSLTSAPPAETSLPSSTQTSQSS
jgi:hypothetical protein